MFFLSARGKKVSLPLSSIGFNPPIVTVGPEGLGLVRGALHLMLVAVRHPRAAIFTDTADRLGFVAWVVSVLFRRKLIYRARGDAIREGNAAGSIFWKLSNRWLFFPRLTGVIPCSNYLGKMIAIDYPTLPPSRIVTVNLPAPFDKCDMNLSGFDEREKWIIISTKFHFYDKIKPLLDILPLLIELFARWPEFRLVILGEGKYQQVLRCRIREFGLEDRTDFLGYVLRPENFYARGFCLLHVSDLDGYPSVIDEARLNRLPVISSNTVGLPEMVEDGVDGFLLEHGFGNLSSVIRALLDRDTNHRITQAGYARVIQNNSHERIGHQFLRAIDKILEDGSTTFKQADLKRRVRVLFVIKDFERVGGGQRHLSLLLESLRKEIHGYVACLMPLNRRIFQQIPGVQVEMGFGPPKYSIGGIFTSAKRVRDFIRDHRIDIVYAYGFEASFVTAISAKMAGVPFVSRRGELAQWRRFYHWLAFGLINFLSDRIVGNSPQVLEVTHRELFSRGKTELIRNCIRTTYSPSDKMKRDKPIIGTVANLRQVKNQKMLIDVVPQIIRKCGEIEVWLIGEGPDCAMLQKQIKDLGLEKQVLLLGYQPDVRRLLKRMDCFVLTSVSEGGPHAILEAMSEGLPVVATNVGGNKDAVVEGKTGFLVDVNDMNGLEKRIVEIIKNPDLCCRMGEQGKQYAQDVFSIEISSTAHKKIFWEILQRKNQNVIRQIEDVFLNP